MKYVCRSIFRYDVKAAAAQLIHHPSDSLLAPDCGMGLHDNAFDSGFQDLQFILHKVAFRPFYVANEIACIETGLVEHGEQSCGLNADSLVTRQVHSSHQEIIIHRELHTAPIIRQGLIENLEFTFVPVPVRLQQSKERVVCLYHYVAGGAFEYLIG